MAKQRAIVFIDTEAALESPARELPAQPWPAAAVAGTLSRHGVPAVFNACGRLIEQFPDGFRALEAAGHEVALHGWAHENLRLLDDRSLEDTLRRSHQTYAAAFGHPPAGFRAPWLEYDGRLVRWLADNGYHWTSHRHLPFRERFLTPALRPELRGGRAPGALWATVQEWRFQGSPRRITEAMWDIPLTSSMDGELLGLISPQQPTSSAVTDYCLAAWRSQARRHRACFTLNLHDWLIGTTNRPELLDRCLAVLHDLGFTFHTASNLLREAHAVTG